MDDERLMTEARKHDLVLRLRYRPGDYLHVGRTLMEAWPTERVSEEAAEGLRESYKVGDKRTPYGDLDFLVEELVEIAARALSTGVNDPATARTCMDWLGAGASEIAGRDFPSPERADCEGTVRVIAQPDRFEDYLERSFGALRQYVARDMAATLHALRTLGEIAVACSQRSQMEAVQAETNQLLEMAADALDGPALATVSSRGAALRRMIEVGKEEGAEAADGRQADWLSGTA